MRAKSKERLSYLCNEQHMSGPSLEMFFLLRNNRKTSVIVCLYNSVATRLIL